jgi:hypothetical protein
MPVLLRCFVTCLIAVCLSAFSLVAQESPANPPSPNIQWWILLEPKSLRTDASTLFPGAQGTVMTPADPRGEGPPRRLDLAELKKLGIGWKEFFRRSAAEADRILANTKPEFKEADGTTPAHAIIRSQFPPAGSLLIAPSLLSTFEGKFGTPLLLATPERGVLYVFAAKDREQIAALAPAFVSLYEQSTWPGSAELYQLSKDDPLPIPIGQFAKD